MNREQLMASLLVEQFGRYGHEPKPVEDRRIKAQRRRVLNEAMEGSDEVSHARPSQRLVTSGEEEVRAA